MLPQTKTCLLVWVLLTTEHVNCVIDLQSTHNRAETSNTQDTSHGARYAPLYGLGGHTNLLSHHGIGGNRGMLVLHHGGGHGYGGIKQHGYGGIAHRGYGGIKQHGYGGIAHRGYGGIKQHGYGGIAHRGYGGLTHHGYGGISHHGFGGNRGLIMHHSSGLGQGGVLHGFHSHHGMFGRQDMGGNTMSPSRIIIFSYPGTSFLGGSIPTHKIQRNGLPIPTIQANGIGIKYNVAELNDYPNRRRGDLYLPGVRLHGDAGFDRTGVRKYAGLAELEQYKKGLAGSQRDWGASEHDMLVDNHEMITSTGHVLGGYNHGQPGLFNFHDFHGNVGGLPYNSEAVGNYGETVGHDLTTSHVTTVHKDTSVSHESRPTAPEMHGNNNYHTLSNLHNFGLHKDMYSGSIPGGHFGESGYHEESGYHGHHGTSGHHGSFHIGGSIQASMSHGRGHDMDGRLRTLEHNDTSFQKYSSFGGDLFPDEKFGQDSVSGKGELGFGEGDFSKHFINFEGGTQNNQQFTNKIFRPNNDENTVLLEESNIRKIALNSEANKIDKDSTIQNILHGAENGHKGNKNYEEDSVNYYRTELPATGTKQNISDVLQSHGMLNTEKLVLQNQFQNTWMNGEEISDNANAGSWKSYDHGKSEPKPSVIIGDADRFLDKSQFILKPALFTYSPILNNSALSDGRHALQVASNSGLHINLLPQRKDLEGTGTGVYLPGSTVIGTENGSKLQNILASAIGVKQVQQKQPGIPLPVRLLGSINNKLLGLGVGLEGYNTKDDANGKVLTGYDSHKYDHHGVDYGFGPLPLPVPYQPCYQSSGRVVVTPYHRVHTDHGYDFKQYAIDGSGYAAVGNSMGLDGKLGVGLV